MCYISIIVLICILIKHVMYMEYSCKWCCAIDLILFLTIFTQHSFISYPHDRGTCSFLLTASFILPSSGEPLEPATPITTSSPPSDNCVSVTCERVFPDCLHFLLVLLQVLFLFICLSTFDESISAHRAFTMILTLLILEIFLIPNFHFDPIFSTPN